MKWFNNHIKNNNSNTDLEKRIIKSNISKTKMNSTRHDE
jgi:hypothetical protein